MDRITYNGQEHILSINYSLKDFTGHDLTAKEDMNDIIIYGSCFSHESPDSDVFPNNLSGVTFVKCNLSNCKIPEGNIVIDCNQTRLKVQNDLRDWEIDSENKPVKVIGENAWIQQGLSVDPIDIPSEKLKSLEEIKKAGG